MAPVGGPAAVPDVVATSREGLRVDAEQLWPVPSLDVGGGAASAAAALFVERARSVNPGFDFDDAAVNAAVDMSEAIGGPFPTIGGTSSDGADCVDLTVGGLNQHVVVWNLDIEQWPDIACRAAGCNLTQAEWARYLGDERSDPSANNGPALHHGPKTGRRHVTGTVRS